MQAKAQRKILLPNIFYRFSLKFVRRSTKVRMIQFEPNVTAFIHEFRRIMVSFALFLCAQPHNVRLFFLIKSTKQLLRADFVCISDCYLFCKQEN